MERFGNSRIGPSRAIRIGFQQNVRTPHFLARALEFLDHLPKHFAFRFKRTMYDQGQIQAHIKKILADGGQGTTWELYRSICGIPLDKDWTERWFRTLILDKTDDIDYPEDYQKKIESGYYDDPEFDL